MDEKKMIIIGVMTVVFLGFVILINILDSRGINSIKSKKVGDGQHGTARWATKGEMPPSADAKNHPP